MTVVGMWLAIVGYGIAFAGMNKLGGGQCSIIDAFRNRCQPGTKPTASSGSSGTTLLASQQAAQQQQAAMIGTQPISQAM
jgi:hypothetical protein